MPKERWLLHTFLPFYYLWQGDGSSLLPTVPSGIELDSGAGMSLIKHKCMEIVSVPLHGLCSWRVGREWNKSGEKWLFPPKIHSSSYRKTDAPFSKRNLSLAVIKYQWLVVWANCNMTHWVQCFTNIWNLYIYFTWPYGNKKMIGETVFLRHSMLASQTTLLPVEAVFWCKGQH